MKTKKDTGLTTEKFKTALSVVKTALVEGIKYKFGDNAGKIAEFIFTKPELIASMAAMGDKKAKEGELNSADYAGLVKDILAYGILTAELGGATASTIAVAGVVISPLAILMGVAGAALFAYEHQNDISTIIDNYNKLVGSGEGGISGDPMGFGMPWVPEIPAPAVIPSSMQWVYIGGDGDGYSDPDDFSEGEFKQVFKPGTDPLVIDLKNSFTHLPDGIETVGLDAGIQFDFNGNGVKQATGWIGPSDGLLVMDRNGNGTIDDGTELFGNNAAGQTDNYGNQIGAADGYAALAKLDTNNDYEITSLDANFNNLRVWQDLNQLGIVNIGVSTLPISVYPQQINNSL